MKYFILLLITALTFLSSCEKKEVNPSITTLEANPISTSSCTAKAVINEFGTHAITDHGFVFSFGSSENLNYISEQNKVSLGKVIPSDTFSTTFSLSTSSPYYYSGYKWYVRSYITNDKGTVYGNSISFDPLMMSLKDIVPSTGRVGDTISINGNNFDLITMNNTVQFYYYYNYYTAKIVEASKTRLRVIVPSINSNYYDSFCDIKVTSGTQSSTLTDVFSFLSKVTGFSPKTGCFGTTIAITGNFLSQSTVMFDNTSVGYFSSNSTIINVNVPNTITFKKFKIYVLSGSTKLEVPGGEFVMNNLTATSINPTTAFIGSSVSIYGTNFNNYYNTVLFGSNKSTSVSLGANYLYATIPNYLTPGDYVVTVSNGIDTETVPGVLKIVNTTISSISPSSGYWGTDLTISGHNFNPNYSSVFFNESIYSAYSYDTASYKIKIPTSLLPGSYRILVYNGISHFQSPTNFTVLAPTLTSITPANGAAGTSVIITGGGFGNGNSTVTVKLGNTTATVSTFTNTQINFTVPQGVGSGSYIVSVILNGSTLTKTLTFSVP